LGLQAHCTEVKLQSGESDSVLCACLLDFYVIDEIEKGVFILMA